MICETIAELNIDTTITDEVIQAAIADNVIDPCNPKIRLKLRYKHQARKSRRGAIAHTKRPIVLRPNQLEHLERVSTILTKSPFAFDFSMMGTGKTYTSSQLFRDGKFKWLVCIVPSSVKSKWEYMREHHGIESHYLISYSELRSMRFKQPKHKLLTRRDFTRTIRSQNGESRQIKCCTFSATNLFLNMVREGVLLVIDEIQNVKNISDQLLACQELIRPIIEQYNYAVASQTPNHQGSGSSAGAAAAAAASSSIHIAQAASDHNLASRSKALLLSGSPIDKESQVIHFYRCLGIIQSEKLRNYNPYTGEKEDSGILEIKRYLQQNFRQRYTEYQDEKYRASVQAWNWMMSVKANEDTITDLVHESYDMFQKIVKPELSSAMPPLTNHTVLTKVNTYYPMNPADQRLYLQGVETLEQATNFNRDRSTINFGNNGVEALMNIQRALSMIETSKIETLYLLTKRRLEENPQQKVVICVNYLATIRDLTTILAQFNPLVLTGSVSSNQRMTILEQFQEASGKYRLLIGNVSVCSTGIDLDDQDGLWPRVCYVNPNYSAISLYQLGHRFQRLESKSDATIEFVFGNTENTELPVINALAKKGQVLGETVEAQREAGILFPGDYPDVYYTSI